MMKILRGFAMFVVVVSATAQRQNWVIQADKSEMTDEHFTLIMTKAEGTSDDSGAAFGLKCSPDQIDIAVFTTGADYQPAQTGLMELYGHWYQHPATDVRLRFDSEKATGALKYVLANPNLMLAYRYGPTGKGMVKKLLGTKRLLFEYTTYTGKTKVLAFDVTGLQEQLAKVGNCKVN